MANTRRPLLVTDWKALPNGFYLQRAAGAGLDGHAIGVVSAKKVPVGRITWVPGTLTQKDTFISAEHAEDKTHKITPKDLREQATGAFGTVIAGGTLMLTAELFDRLGTTATAKHWQRKSSRVPVGVYPSAAD